MKISVVACALAAMVASGAVSAQKFDDATDRFTGKRTIKFVAKPNLSAPTASTFLVVDGGKPDPVVIVSVFTPMQSGGSWRYLRCNGTYWLVDGKALPLDPVVHEGSVMKAGVVEHLMQKVSVAQLRTIAAGTKVEFKICNDEYIMDSQDLEGLKSVSSAYAD